MSKQNIKKDIIHAKGIDISIYTKDFENEFISLTDIALEFASWISAEFKLYIVKDYQRLKQDKNSRLSLNWNLNREIAKINYKIHTDAIKNNLISAELTNIMCMSFFAGARKVKDIRRWVR